MDELPELLDRIYAHLARLKLPAASALLPGLSLAAIEEHVKDLPFHLPREIYTLYQWRDGVPESRRDAGLFPDALGDWIFHSLEDALIVYRRQIEIAHEYGGDDWTQLWHPRWFPVFENDVPTSLCVLGQKTATDSALILYVDVEGGSNDEEYPSLTHLMRVVTECYDTGAFSVDADGAPVADKARVGAIRRQHEPRRADAALAAITHGPNAPEYARAINDVITFHDPRAISPLLRALEMSDYMDTGVITALGEIGEEEVIAPLLHAVRTGEKLDRGATGISAKWAEALRYMDRENSARSAARAVAMQSVVMLAERVRVPLPVAPFAAALEDPLTWVRARAIWALERIGTPEARDAIALSFTDPDDGIRLAARQALERLG